MITEDYEIARLAINERRIKDESTHDYNLDRENRAKAEDTIVKAQNRAMKNTNQSMIITIDDPDEDKHGKRRVIRINGVRFYKRGIARKPQYDVQWLDPTFVSRRPWNFNVPVAALGQSIKTMRMFVERSPELFGTTPLPAAVRHTKLDPLKRQYV